MITVFKNIRETSTPFYRAPIDMIVRIRGEKDKAAILAIRKSKDKAERNRLKTSLLSICWSGKFPQRNDGSILEHSGLICLDFDELKPAALLTLKTKLHSDPFVYASFVSPSGNGLKVLVRIPPDPSDHKAYFDALGEHFNEPSFDVTSSNLSRVCYISHDPDLYLNENSDVWTEKKEKDFYSFDTRTPEIRLRSESEIVRRLLKWWSKKYGMVEGERNANAFKLAAAFNDFGVNVIEARAVMMDMAHDGFDTREIEQVVSSAYSKKDAHGSKYFEDTVTRSHIQNAIISGESKASIKVGLLDRMPEKEAEAAINAVERASPWVEFWTKDDKGKVRIVHHRFKAWLEHNGFRKLYPEGSDHFVFVRVENNLIDNTTSAAIKDYVLAHLHDRVPDIFIYEHMAGATRYFKDDYLSMLSPIEATFVGDTVTTGTLYYENCALRVDPNDLEIIDYLDLEGYVWRKQIIGREWSGDGAGTGDFSRFIELLAGKDAQRIDSLMSTIGYLMHSHKSAANNRAVILNDEEVSNNPNGGSGKGLFCQAIGKMKRLVTLDGKVFSFDKSFLYQTVGADTQVLAFDDVAENFHFERLFSVITEGITLEKKNKDAVKLPVDKSPKVVITTNYTIKGDGGSFDRRKWEVELSAHFNDRHTPLDEFGHLFFDDWDLSEWQRFDRYMVYCMQLFLTRGLISCEFKNTDIKKLRVKTASEFHEWAMDGHLPCGVRLFRSTLYDAFTEEYDDYGVKGKYKLTKKRFAHWLNAWASYKNYDMEDGKDQVGSRYTLFTERK